MYARSSLTKRALQSLAVRHSRYRYSSTSTTASTIKPLTSILIANRGEIALFAVLSSPFSTVSPTNKVVYRRVNRTASQYGIRTTTVYTEPDALAQHALVTPHSVNIGPPSAYLDVDKIIRAAKEYGCDSIHPGYGFVGGIRDTRIGN